MDPLAPECDKTMPELTRLYAAGKDVMQSIENIVRIGVEHACPELKGQCIAKSSCDFDACLSFNPSVLSPFCHGASAELDGFISGVLAHAKDALCGMTRSCHYPTPF